MRSVLKWVGIGLGGCLAVAAAGVALSYVWLRSDGGGDWLARHIERAVSTPGEVELRIGRLEGDLPAELRLQDIALSDAEGPWLTIAALDVRWHPWDLLDRTLTINSLTLTGVELVRQPKPPVAAEEDAARQSAGGLPSLPLRIRVHQFAADEIALGAPVLGQAARFTLAGEATGQEDGRVAAGVELLRLDGVEAKLLAQLDYDPTSDQLTASLTASEAPGGLVATLLDLPDLPRTELHLNGSGPLSSWAGDFALSLGEMAQAEAAIRLERGAAGDLGFSLEGHGDIDPPAEDAAWEMIRGRTEIALAGAWRDTRRLQLDHFSATGEILSLSAAGSFEPESGALGMTMNLSAGESALLAGMLDLDRLGPLTAEVALTGTLERPEAALGLQIAGLAGPDFEAAALNITGRASAASDLLGPSPGLDLDLAGRIAEAQLIGEDEVNAILDDDLPWTLRGKLDLTSLALDIAALEAATAGARLTANGPFDLESGSARLQAALAVDDLTKLQPLTDITLGGQARLAGPVDLKRFGNRLQGELQGRWEQPSSDVDVIAAAAGAGMDISLRLDLDGATLRIEDVRANSPVAAVEGALSITADPTTLDGHYLLTLPDAAALAAALGGAFSGPARVEGDIRGPVENPSLNGKLQVRQLTIEDQPLRDLQGSYRLTLRGADVDGPVDLSLISPFGSARAEGELKVRSAAVGLAALQIDLAETRVRGAVTLPLDGGAPIAELDGEIGDLGPWFRVAGLAGGGRGSVSLKLNQPDAAAPVLANAELSGITVVPEPDGTPIGAASLSLTLEAQDPALEQAASFKLRGKGITRDSLSLERLDLDGKGTAADLDVTLAAAGRWIEAFQLEAAAGISQSGDDIKVTLREAEGRAFGHPLRLRQATVLTLAAGETRLENLDLASGDTRLTAEVRLGGEEIAVTAALEDLPMTTVDAFWQNDVDGRITARLDLQGPLDSPHGSASLNASGLRPRGAKDLPELALNSSAEWRGGRVSLKGEFGGKEVSAARFSLEAPLQLSVDGGSLEIPDDGPISGDIDWTGDVSDLLLFVPLPQHSLNGRTNIALDIGGTAGTPRLNGAVTVSDGRYENYETGTVLRQLELAAEVAGDRASLTRLSASDGAKGKISGEGKLLIDSDQGFPFDVAIALEGFRAVHRDDVTAVVGGDIAIGGTADSPKIEGLITTETVEVNLLANLPASVVSLDVIEVKNGVVQEDAQEDQAAPPVEAALDVTIDMPSRVFVRGRGLDSDWAGRIFVKGTTAVPEISGEVRLVRGALSVVGKSFSLTEGRVSLPKGADAEPQLDVTALHKGKDLEVTAKMTGPVSQPELELSSVPEVPRDEIISRVLFGKSASQLSAGEAAQLALAVRDLSGSGNQTDVLGFARRAMGVDVLQLGTTAEGDTAVKAGKYVTEGVYVGVKQGATSDSSGAEVEVDLTPNVKVETETSGSGESKAGVRFQLDY